MDNLGELPPITHQENKFADYVVDSVDKYEALNAPKMEKADQQFTDALISILKNKTVDPQKLGPSYQFVVQQLDDTEHVVVKRLRAEPKGQGDKSLNEYWDALQKEHELAKKYFGREFIPDTEFIVIDHHFGDPNPLISPEPEHVIVQEKVEGEDYADDSFPKKQKYESPQLKKKMIEFIKRYETMMRQEEVIIEEQLKIDPTTDKIKILDTNHFNSFKNRIAQKDFLDKFGIDPQSIKTAEDAIKQVTTHIPAFFPLRDATYSQFVAECQTYKLKAYDGLTEKEKIALTYIVTAIENFPPEGEHNPFVRSLMIQFGIDEAEIESQKNNYTD